MTAFLYQRSLITPALPCRPQRQRSARRCVSAFLAESAAPGFASVPLRKLQDAHNCVRAHLPLPPCGGGPTRPKAERGGGAPGMEPLVDEVLSRVSRRGRGPDGSLAPCPAADVAVADLGLRALCPATPFSLGLRPSRSSPPRGRRNAAGQMCACRSSSQAGGKRPRDQIVSCPAFAAA